MLGRCCAHRHVTAGLAVALLLAAFGSIAPVAGADHSALELVSDRFQAGADSANAAIFGGASSDGTRVFFQTTEPLVAADGDSANDIYQRASGLTAMVSDRIQAGPDGAADQAFFGGASTDGSRVFFVTTEPLAAADGDAASDVYARGAGGTSLVSDRIQAGADSANGAFFKGGSSDGTRVFFETSEPIVAADGDADQDVYMRAPGGTSLLSDRVQAGADGAATAGFGGASSDGTLVFFGTTEPLVAADGDSTVDLYVRGPGGTSLLSDRIQAGPDSGNPVGFGGASTDGTRVFFTTDEPLLAADGDSAQDVYQRGPGGTSLLSDRIQAGADGTSAVFFAGASSDGTHVFFTTNEPLLAADGDSALDVYQRGSGGTSLLSDRIRFGSDSGDSASFEGASSDGTRVFFRTREKVVLADSDAALDVYQRASGVTTLLSDRVQSSADSGDSAGFEGASSDGTRVFLTTVEPLLVSDPDATQDLYERTAGTTSLLASPSPVPASFAGASSDGKRVFFHTPGALVAADGDVAQDIYLTSVP